MINKLIKELNNIKVKQQINLFNKTSTDTLTVEDIDKLINDSKNNNDKLKMIINLLSEDLNQVIKTHLQQRFNNTIKDIINSLENRDTLLQFGKFIQDLFDLNDEKIQQIITPFLTLKIRNILKSENKQAKINEADRLINEITEEAEKAKENADAKRKIQAEQKKYNEKVRERTRKFLKDAAEGRAMAEARKRVDIVAVTPKTVVPTQSSNSTNQIESLKAEILALDRKKAEALTRKEAANAKYKINYDNIYKVQANIAQRNMTTFSETITSLRKKIKNMTQKKGGGKKTSKRHPIRRTFRKKDKQYKKKNVSRKKHYK